MKIVFLSGGERYKAFEALVDQKEEIVALIVPRLTENNMRHLKTILIASKHGIPTYFVEKDNLNSILGSLEYDLLVSCGFPYLIGSDVIERSLSINVHPTLLPKYRGYRSGPYVIINGERKSGATVHLLTAGMDDGDIILQESIELSSFDTTKSCFRKVREIEGELLCKAVMTIKDGTYSLYKQDESQASRYDYIRTPRDSQIDPEKPLTELYDQIRACDPVDYPAFFYVEGQKVNIKLWRDNKSKEEEDMI